MKVLSEHRKARFEYEILETLEAGLQLLGTEVKSLKARGTNLAGTFVVFKGKGGAQLPEAFWIGAHVAPYQPANAPKDYDPERSRKLLLTKKEISSMVGKARQKGLTFIPLRLYLKANKIKLQVALVRKKKKYDKRESIRKRDIERSLARELKERG